MMQFLLPLLEGLGASGAGSSLLTALGGGSLGTAAGTPMAGAQGATQGTGLFGALSGGGFNPLTENKIEEQKSPQYQFTQQRFRPTKY